MNLLQIRCDSFLFGTVQVYNEQKTAFSFIFICEELTTLYYNLLYYIKICFFVYNSVDIEMMLHLTQFTFFHFMFCVKAEFPRSVFL